MKSLFFNQNNFIEKNNFSQALKKEIRKMFNEYFKDYYKVPLDFEVFDKKISNLNTYEHGDKTLRIIKRQIYPFWLMYLGYDTKEDLLNRMIEDKIVFDASKYPIDKNIKKINIEEFISFCIKNNKHILKLGNVLKLEREEEIEVI